MRIVNGFIRAAALGVILLTSVPGIAAAQKVVASGLGFPEGTIFVGDTLYLVDYAASDVLRVAHGKVETVWHQDGCGANGLANVAGELLVACYDSGTIVGITTRGRVRETIAHDDAGGRFVNPNDLAPDLTGGVYFTGSGNAGVAGKVYYRDPAGHVRIVADGISYANGLVVSNDGTRLYLAESEKHRLLSFRIGTHGQLSDGSELVTLANILADGRHAAFTPDGVRLDRQGRLFIGLYDGGGFAVLTGEGKLIKKIELPAAHHANLAISPDGKSVFVTATDDSPDGSRHGAVFEVDNPVPE